MDQCKSYQKSASLQRPQTLFKESYLNNSKSQFRSIKLDKIKELESLQRFQNLLKESNVSNSYIRNRHIKHDQNNESNNHLSRKPYLKHKLFALFKTYSKSTQPNSSNDSYAIEDIKRHSDNAHLERSHSLALNSHSHSKRYSEKSKRFATTQDTIQRLSTSDLILIDKLSLHPLNVQILKIIAELDCSAIKLPAHWMSQLGSDICNNALSPFLSLVPGLLGLDNHGNTCYVNVIIQCIAHIDSVAEYFATKDYLQAINPDNNPQSVSPVNNRLAESATGLDVMVGFSYLLQSLWQSSYQSKISMKFCQLLSLHKSEFCLDSQQDAHELLLFILNLLHENLTSSTSRQAHDTSFIYQRFRGWLANQIECPECHYSRKSLDQILSLNLQITRRPEVWEHKHQQTADQPVELVDCKRIIYMTVSVHNHAPETHAFIVNTASTIKDLRTVVSDRIGCLKEDVVIMELGSRGFGTWYPDQAEVIKICKPNNNCGPGSFDWCGNGLYATCIPNQVIDVDSLVLENAFDNEINNRQVTRKEFPENQLFIRILVVHVERTKDNIDEISDGLEDIGISNDENPFSNQINYLRFTNILTVQAARKTKISLLRHSLIEQMLKYFNLRNITKLPRPQFIIGGSHLISETDIYPLTHDSVNEDLKRSMKICGEDSAHVRLTIVWPAGITEKFKMYKRKMKENIYNSRNLSLMPHKILSHSSVDELKMKLTKEAMELESNQIRSQSKIHIVDCLREFFSLDTVSIAESWKCPNCQTSQPAKTEIRIEEAPEILILMLKRFSKQQINTLDKFNNHISKHNISTEDYKPKPAVFSKQNQSKSRDCLNKLEGLVDYPLKDLDLAPYMENRTDNISFLYDLVGVVNHRGSLSNGHYVAICHNSIDNKWRLYDDNHVTEIPSSDVVQSDAYILFYKRQKQTDQTDKYSNIHWSYRRLTFPEKFHRNQSPSPTSIYSNYQRFSEKETAKPLDTFSTLPLSITNNHSSHPSLQSRYSPELLDESIVSPCIESSEISSISSKLEYHIEPDLTKEVIDLSQITSAIIDVDSLSIDSFIVTDEGQLKSTFFHSSCSKSLNDDSGTALSQDFSEPLRRKKHRSFVDDNNSKDECYNSFSTTLSTSSPTTSNT